MNTLTPYYLSRFLVLLLVMLLLGMGGTPWYALLAIGVLMAAWFIWAPRSGRYSVNPDLGATALRRDERTQAITDKAARNGFIVLSIALAGLAIAANLAGNDAVARQHVEWLLVLGMLVYFASDFWLRRRM